MVHHSGPSWRSVPTPHPIPAEAHTPWRRKRWHRRCEGESLVGRPGGTTFVHALGQTVPKGDGD